VDRHLDFARNLHLETRVLAGDDPAQTIVDFARRNAVTQILIHRPAATKLPMAFAHQDLVFQLLRLARDFQVTVVANRIGAVPLS
jgi:K+-sensing histidine kinase KdpD